MTNYRVTAKYVLLRVRDQASGKVIITGYYEGAVVSDQVIVAESLDRHVDRGWLEKLDEPAEPAGDGTGGSGEGGESDQGSGPEPDGGSGEGGGQPPAKPSGAARKPRR